MPVHTEYSWVASWCCGRALDSRSRGREVRVSAGHYGVKTLGKFLTPRLVHDGWLTVKRVNHISNQPPRSTQPCIPPGSLNRVPASAGVKAGMSPLPGGRCDTIWYVSSRSGVGRLLLQRLYNWQFVNQHRPLLHHHQRISSRRKSYKNFRAADRPTNNIYSIQETDLSTNVRRPTPLHCLPVTQHIDSHYTVSQNRHIK